MKPQDGQKSFVGVFIERPILALVLSLLIVIAGLAALMGVEVRELPEVDQPVVSVQTRYPGATPESIDSEVTAIIESAISQVNGVESISARSEFGASRVIVEFSTKADIDVAATDIKNAVAAVQRNLPEGAEEPVVVKADADGQPIVRIAVSAEKMSEDEIGYLVDKIIVPRLQSIEGVAVAEAYGVRNRVIRVRLNPVELAARGVSVDDIAALVRRSTVSAPSGSLRSDRQELLIRAEAPVTSPEEIGALRLNDETRLSDLAVVEWGLQRETTRMRQDGTRSVGIGIVRQAQSNTIAIANGVHAAIKELKPSLPAGVDIRVNVDDSIFIKRAIEEVLISLVLAIGIVLLVIFMFLRSASATLIPATAIPISLIGTVAAIWLCGFSINILTLLALVMATGLVVDDAIVVTENVQRWRAKGYGKRAAAYLGAREIVFAILSTTATLAAVFIPISFLPGQAGRLFSEFGFVVAFAVIISSFVALTLCPMLTVKFGSKNIPGSSANSSAFAPMSAIGRVGAGLYEKGLSLALRAPFVFFGAACLFAAGAVVAFSLIPRELTPVEDRGRVWVNVNVQESANFEYLVDKAVEVERRMQRFVASGEAESIASLIGMRSSTHAPVIMILKDWSKRARSQQEIEAEIRPLLSSIPGADVRLARSNSLGIRGAGQGLVFAVAAEDYNAAADVAEQIAARLEQSPMIARADLDFETSTPQLDITIDRDAAARLGVNVESVATLVNTMAYEYKASELFIGDTVVDVYLSSGGAPIDDPGDLANLFVKTRDGSFVPLSLIASIDEKAVAARLSREERRRAVPVTATLASDARLGDAIKELRAVSKDILPDNMSILLMGEAKLLQNSTDSTIIVFAFAGLIVLLVLAAQFESFVNAIVIMVTVPFGLAAAVYAMALTGGSLNYYSQIGLVLIIGIMAKNGILIVEFANQLRDRGLSARDAIHEASMTRLRPVLMTALSTVFGGLPLVLGSGAGAESRAALGWVIVAGLGFATLFTLFLVPASYALLGRFAAVRGQEGALVAEELADGPADVEGGRLKAAE